MSAARLSLEANAKALGKPIWDLDSESVGQIARAIAAGPLSRQRACSRLCRRPSTSGCRGRRTQGTHTEDPESTRLQTDIIHDAIGGPIKVGVIEMDITRRSMFADERRNDFAFIAIFAAAILAIVIASIIGSRLMVMRPLQRLTAAIEATRRLGSRHHVDWVSDDEMGMLASNFNEMQERLAREESGLRQAHARVSQVYNRTPAMLYSIDNRDRIIAVSDYMLLATGYERDQIIGKPFADLLEPECRTHYAERGPDARQWRRRPRDYAGISLRRWSHHRCSHPRDGDGADVEPAGPRASRS